MRWCWRGRCPSACCSFRARGRLPPPRRVHGPGGPRPRRGRARRHAAAACGAGIVSDRGHRGDGYVLLTPANRYASRLPWLPEALVYKLVSPRLEPAAFSQQLICLDHAPRAPAVVPSDCEQFIYVLSGELRASVDGARARPVGWELRVLPRRQRARAGGRDGRPRDPDPPRVVSAGRRWSARAHARPQGRLRAERDGRTRPGSPRAVAHRRPEPSTSR